MHEAISVFKKSYPHINNYSVIGTYQEMAAITVGLKPSPGLSCAGDKKTWVKNVFNIIMHLVFKREKVVRRRETERKCCHSAL